jgi:hypothetical protein
VRPPPPKRALLKCPPPPRGAASASDALNATAAKLLIENICLSEEAKSRYVAAYSFGLMYLALGDKERAIDEIERAYRERAGEDIDGIKVDPMLDDLRGNPRFEALVQKVFAPKKAEASSSLMVPAKVDFATQVRPILEYRCTPCHFAGGTMYKRLPFDRQETIKTLGTKLFSRIKDEEERRLIREFLAQ